MTHEQASELLGAYALDAVDGDEFTELEEHLEMCPRCRAELDGLREVAAAMGNSAEKSDWTTTRFPRNRSRAR